MDARHGKARQLASLKQGQPIVKSVPPEGQTADVGLWEESGFKEFHAGRQVLLDWHDSKPELLSNLVSEALLTRRLSPWLFLQGHQ